MDNFSNEEIRKMIQDHLADSMMYSLTAAMGNPSTANTSSIGVSWLHQPETTGKIEDISRKGGFSTSALEYAERYKQECEAFWGLPKPITITQWQYHHYIKDMDKGKQMRTTSQKYRLSVVKMDFYETLTLDGLLTFCSLELKVKENKPAAEASAPVGGITGGFTYNLGVIFSDYGDSKKNLMSGTIQTDKNGHFSLVGMARKHPNDLYSELIGKRTALTNALKVINKEYRVPAWEHFKRHVVDAIEAKLKAEAESKNGVSV